MREVKNGSGVVCGGVVSPSQRMSVEHSSPTVQRRDSSTTR